MMKRWLVVTPEYGEVVPILDYGQGPMEYQSDVIEIEAETRRDAIVLGVKAMRQRPREYHWFRHCDNPLAGVKAKLVPPMCRACEGYGLTDNHVTGEVECSACQGSGIEQPQAVRGRSCRWNYHGLTTRDTVLSLFSNSYAKADQP